MIWFNKLITKWAERIHHRQLDDMVVPDELLSKRSRRSNKHSIGINSTPRRVEHNYDDESVINFKVYGANGGKIVETSRYDDKKDTESIRRYVIDENADLGESLSKIVTMEYLR
jgi:hypothetical protein